MLTLLNVIHKTNDDYGLNIIHFLINLFRQLGFFKVMKLWKVVKLFQYIGVLTAGTSKSDVISLTVIFLFSIPTFFQTNLKETS